jgi:hypothetical protein
MAKHIRGIELASQLQRNIQMVYSCQGQDGIAGSQRGKAVIKNKSVVAKWLSPGCQTRSSSSLVGC